jgi:hypothetical protein
MESNIHLIPKDKFSKLQLKRDGGLHLEDGQSIALKSFLNIYITDNSEIRDWWVLNTQTNKVYFVKGFYGVRAHAKKIILTNDIDLIQDGIQSISDEFLQWFVENPSCKRVEVKSTYFTGLDRNFVIYKIILPQEEPKQETLEEAAINYAHNYFNMHETNNYQSLKQGFKNGAKWQVERMYSDMQEYAEFCIECDRKEMPLLLVQDWYEHYKN